MLAGTLQDLSAIAPGGTSSGDEAPLAVISAIRDSFDFVGGRFESSGRAYGEYVITEEGGLIEAMLEIFSYAARQYSPPAGEPSPSTE
jgi:hypothetical protein